MAWNRPSEDKVKVRGERRNVHLKGLVAGAVVVLGAAVAWWLLSDSGGRGATRPTVQKNGRIQDVAQKRPNGKGVLSEYIGKVQLVHEKPSTNAADQAQAEAEALRKKFGRIVVWTPHEKPIFSNTFENVLCQIVTAEPGERFLELDLVDDFDEKFRMALKNPVAVSKDDDEYVAELKKVVREATEEVRQAVAEGRKPSEVILEARDELNRIADYRDQLQEAFNKNVLQTTDPKEVLRLAEEANRMLDEYGALHIDAPLNEEDAEEYMLTLNAEEVWRLDAIEKKEKEKQKK